MTVLDRAYSLFAIKAVDEERRIVEGMASTPQVDRVGDIVEPMGVTFAKSVPLLLHHDSRLPVGEVRFGKPTKDGVPFTAFLPKVAEEGAVKARVDEAWHSVKYRLIAAVSIGFRALEDGVERIDTGYRFVKTELMELSLVAVPANSGALITSIKSMDAATIASIKQFDVGVPDSEIQQAATAPKGTKVRTVKLNPGPRQGQPFVIRKINRVT